MACEAIQYGTYAYADAAGELMCRFAIADDGGASSFVAPLEQLALERSAQEIDPKRRNHAQAWSPAARMSSSTSAQIVAPVVAFVVAHPIARVFGDSGPAPFG